MTAVPKYEDIYNKMIYQLKPQLINAVMRKYSMSYETAEDITSEVIIDYYIKDKEGKRKNVKDVGKYLYRACMYVCYHKYEEESKCVNYETDSKAPSAVVILAEKVDENPRLSEASREKIEAIVETMPNLCKNIFWALYDQEINPLATAKNVGLNTVGELNAQRKSCLSKLKELLKKDLEDLYNEFYRGL